jgi:alcohol dehydrogenase
MENFFYFNSTKIIFGKDTETTIGEEIKQFGRKVLLHTYDDDIIKKIGLYDRIMKILQKNGYVVHELGGVQPNPRLALVNKGITLCRRENIDCILAVGGGSVIDSAKAIGIGVPYKGDVWDFFSGKATIKETLPVGVVLTIPAAGSESSNGSVITNENGWYKRPVLHDLIRPKFAILNPELTYSLPPYQTACGAVDIMTHVMERYFTRVTDVDLTDRLCEATLKSVIKNLPIVLENPKNYAARAEIMWAGTIAHSDLLQTGRIPDWGSHNIGHELSAIYDIAHGASLAIIFPAWMKYVFKEHVTKFAQFAVRVCNVDDDFDNPERTALEGIIRTKSFFRSVGLQVSLEELNIPGDKFEVMATKCTSSGPIGNLKQLYKQDVLNILTMAEKK